MKKRHSLRDELDRIRKHREATELVVYNGILMTRKTKKELKEKYCGMCGKEKKNPKLYFRELFCGDCVEKAMAGK